MRRYRGKDGSECLWYDEDEIEEITFSALQAAGMVPSLDSIPVDIERFVDAHLGVRFEPYADLDPDVLGVTEFTPGHQPRIRINRDLTGSALDEDHTPMGVLGRWRATLAHEASHVLLHRSLFESSRSQLCVFGSEGQEESVAPRIFHSLKRDVGFANRSGDWREIQANKGMAALLMPKAIFLQVCDREVERSPISKPSLREYQPEVRAMLVRLSESFKLPNQTERQDPREAWDSADRLSESFKLPNQIGRQDPRAVWDLAGRLSNSFQVSRQAASIRLETLHVPRRLDRPRFLR
jgi:hypothetical protein